MQKPNYLYKILSLRHWQATKNRQLLVLPADDDVVIHLAAEEQQSADQCAILKIDVSKIEGNLVQEGGQYLLYNGFIPFSAIVETKWNSPDKPRLCIVQAGDPVLRQPARELSLAEIRSQEIQNLIEEMKAAMRAAPGVGLAAPQIGKPLQLIVIEDEDLTHLSAEQLQERDRYPVPFHVIINPKIYLKQGERAEFFEGCLSVPEFIGMVPRAKAVRVECLNEHGEPVVIEAKGWYARILQHEIDHLNATLYIDRAYTPTLMTEENYVKYWKGKSIPQIRKELTNQSGGSISSGPKVT